MSVQKVEYLREIMAFFIIIINKYFIRDLKCQELTIIASQIFDWKANLHSRVFANCNSADVVRSDFEMSETAKRIESERNWRENEIKVGDKIDVVKPALIRDLVVYSWSRGTVIFRGIPEDDTAQEVSASPSSN